MELQRGRVFIHEFYEWGKNEDGEGMRNEL